LFLFQGVVMLAGLNCSEWFKDVHVSPEAIESYREAA